MSTVKNVNKTVNSSFESSVMDKCIVRLNEMASVKMASISSKKRPQAKADREAAKYLITVWDDKAALNNILVQEAKETTLSEELLGMIKQRIELLAEKEVKEEPKKAKTPAKKSAETAEDKSVGAPKKYSVGDRHPDHATWIWTEYKPGKFDWRTDPLAKKKPGAKPKKAETAKAEPKSDKTIKSKDKTIKAAKAKKKVVSGYTIEELLAKPTPSGLNKNQKDIRKLLAKGYRLININNAYFLKLETEQKSVDMASLEALLKRYNVDGLPKDIMMK